MTQSRTHHPSFGRKIGAVALAAVLALPLAGAGAPVLAQTPIMDDPLDDRSRRRLDNMEKVMRELRTIVFQGRNTGKPVVVQPAETESQMLTLTQRVDDLEQTLRRVNGDNETLIRDLDQARRGVTAAEGRAASLESRLSALEAQLAATQAPPPPPTGTLGSLPAGPNLAGAPAAPAPNAAAAFQAANALLLEGDYAGAEGAFTDFIARYPDHARAPEANYRLGQTLTARRATADAAGAYIAAIRGYPKTAWAPDAMLELARSLLTQGDRANACSVLTNLSSRYPTASSQVKGRAATTAVQARCAA
jgi:tol-pal system protein YbgF